MAAALELGVHVLPRASRSGIDGVDADGRLRVRATAAPVEGAANNAVVALLAAELGLPPRGVTIVAGATARQKRVRLDGVDAAQLSGRWPGLRLGGRPST